MKVNHIATSHLIWGNAREFYWMQAMGFISLNIHPHKEKFTPIGCETALKYEFDYTY